MRNMTFIKKDPVFLLSAENICYKMLRHIENLAKRPTLTTIQFILSLRVQSRRPFTFKQRKYIAIKRLTTYSNKRAALKGLMFLRHFYVRAFLCKYSIRARNAVAKFIYAQDIGNACYKLTIYICHSNYGYERGTSFLPQPRTVYVTLRNIYSKRTFYELLPDLERLLWPQEHESFFGIIVGMLICISCHICSCYHLTCLHFNSGKKSNF